MTTLLVFAAEVKLVETNRTDKVKRRRCDRDRNPVLAKRTAKTAIEERTRLAEEESELSLFTVGEGC